MKASASFVAMSRNADLTKELSVPKDTPYNSQPSTPTSSQEATPKVSRPKK